MPTARAALLSTIATHVAGIERPHPVRVAVTGICAAGKTTFADELAAALRPFARPLHRCQLDDFHSVGHKWRSARDEYTPRTYYDEGYDYVAFRRLVLDPLAPGGSRRCQFAYFSSYHDEFLPEAWTGVEPDAIVVVDGGMLLRPDLVDS